MPSIEFKRSVAEFPKRNLKVNIKFIHPQLKERGFISF